MTGSTMRQGVLPDFEEELEGEYEGEEFFGQLAQRAARAALGSLTGQSDGEFEDEYELEGEAEYEGEFEYEDEFELEDEWEDELEYEGERMANPLRRVYPDAMMEHLGHAAAEAETEAEAEAFIGALVPLAARLARKAAPHVARSTPQLVRGLSSVARTLRRNPTTRQLVRVLPTVASRTTRTLARHAAHGRPITPRRAIRTLAGQTAAVLSNPRARNHIVRRARALDRTYHRANRTGQWTGAVPGGSATSVRALAPRSIAPGGPAPARYRVPVRYGTPTGYRTPARYGVPAGYRAAGGWGGPSGRGVPVGYGAAVSRQPAQRVRGRGYPRRRRYPAGLSTVWVPVTAWCGSQPPGARRY
jgi:hypothetical protein